MPSFNSSSVVDVGVAITLKNNFSNQANQISQDYGRLLGQLRSQGNIINSSTGTLASAYANIAGAMADAYSYSAGVQKEIWMASKIAGATAQQETELMQIAKDINEKTPLTAADVASAMRYLSMAGFKVDQVKAMIEPVAQLSTILSAPVGGKGGVADMMTNIMATFGIPAEKAASVTDDLYTAVTNTNMSLEDLAQSITYAGSYANVAGISLRETAAAIGVMGNMGIQGSRAGVALGNMFNYLMQSISGARKQGFNALAAVGISPKQLLNSEGRLISLKNTTEVLGNVLRRMTGDQQIAFLKDVMQVRATRATVALYTDMFREISKGGQVYDKIMNTYDKNKGIVNQTLEEFNQKPFGRLEQLLSSLENLKVTMGEALIPFTWLVKSITKVVDAIQSLLKTPLGGWLAQFVGFVTGVNLLRYGFLTVWRTLRMINTTFPIITKSIQGSSSGTMRWSGITNTLVLAFNQLNYSLAILDRRLQGILIKMIAMSNIKRGIMFAGINPATGSYMWRNARTGRFVSNSVAMGPYASFFGMPGFVPMTMSNTPVGAGVVTGGYSGGRGLSARQMREGRLRVRYGSGFRGTAMIGLTRATSGLANVSRGLLGLLGGPWGLGLTAGIMGLSYIIGKVSDQLETEKVNTQAFNYNTDYTKLHSELYAQAMKEAMKELIQDPKSAVSLDIRVNGVPQGIFNSGDSLDINSLNDPFLYGGIGN